MPKQVSHFMRFSYAIVLSVTLYYAYFTLTESSSMATFRKLPSGNWRAEVMVDYKRKSTNFPTKAEAHAWANDATRDLATDKKEIPHKSFGQLLEKYRNEVSVQKLGNTGSASGLSFSSLTLLPRSCHPILPRRILRISVTTAGSRKSHQGAS